MEFLSCFNNISEAVCALDLQLHVVYANSEFLIRNNLSIKDIGLINAEKYLPVQALGIIKKDWKAENSDYNYHKTLKGLEFKEILINDKRFLLIINHSDATLSTIQQNELIVTKEKFNASIEQVKYWTNQLKNFEQKFKEVLNKMPVMFVAFNKHHQIVYWNPECSKVSGLDIGAVKGESGVYRVFPKDDFNGFLKKIEDNDCLHFESKISCENGKVKNILWSCLNNDVSIPDWDFWLVGVDISQKHDQEERVIFESKINSVLAKSSAELISPTLSIDNTARILIESCVELTKSESGFVAFDNPLSDNILIHYFAKVNTQKKALPSNFCLIPRTEFFESGFYGYEIEKEKSILKNKLNIPVKRAIGNKSPKNISSCLIQPAIANGIFVGQIVLVNAPGGFSERSAEFVQSLANIYALAIFRKRMEYELLDAKEKAEESDRLKTAFLANMSHEIRTPMNAIIGFGDLLTNNNISADKKVEFNKIVNNSCDDLLMLVNDIIDISKIEAGQLRFHPAKVEIGELFNEVKQVGLQRISTKGKNISIEFDNETDEAFHLFVDKARLKQVLNNLVSNAIKFTDKGGINIGYHFKEKNHVVFYVKDTGVGIQKDFQEIVFESFRQLETTISRKHGGTGLGLAISKSIVEQMGGKLELNSEPEVGSNFSIRFPYSNKNKRLYNEELPQKKTPVELDLKNKTILVVDDEPRNSILIDVLLSGTKAKILTASNGKEAIAKVKSITPDLVLMDIRMPEMNGLEATKEILKINKDIPVIAQTAFAMKEDEEKCLNAGCKGYIAKPINKNNLYNLIKTTIAQ